MCHVRLIVLDEWLTQSPHTFGTRRFVKSDSSRFCCFIVGTIKHKNRMTTFMLMDVFFSENLIRMHLNFQRLSRVNL